MSPILEYMHNAAVDDDTLDVFVSVGVYVPAIRFPLENVCVPENVAALTSPVSLVPSSLSRSVAINADSARM